MVIGIGIDIIEIDRIKQSVDRFGDKFLNKIFTEVELQYCLSKPNKYQHLAARFAAKEAVAKALSEGWDGGFNWKDIEIYNELSGKPSVKLYGKLDEYLGNDKGLKLTMSHSQNYVTSFAIVFVNEL
ncbi:MAG: holo-ACP synthase [Bacteroidota bacterium]|nr:holo-ACP synthase [Bacteroidota bacterium]MDP4193877.1 holo-ACP synthase [Bacteroidota bacterium]